MWGTARDWSSGGGWPSPCPALEMREWKWPSSCQQLLYPCSSSQGIFQHCFSAHLACLAWSHGLHNSWGMGMGSGVGRDSSAGDGVGAGWDFLCCRKNQCSIRPLCSPQTAIRSLTSACLTSNVVGTSARSTWGTASKWRRRAVSSS